MRPRATGARGPSVISSGPRRVVRGVAAIVAWSTSCCLLRGRSNAAVSCGVSAGHCGRGAPFDGRPAGRRSVCTDKRTLSTVCGAARARALTGTAADAADLDGPTTTGSPDPVPSPSTWGAVVGAASDGAGAGAAATREAGTGVVATAGSGAGSGGDTGRGGRKRSGSRYPCGSPIRRMPRWTYGRSCSASPLGPIVPTTAPSATSAERRTVIEPRCVSVTEYPSPVWIVRLRPLTGTAPANETMPAAGATTSAADGGAPISIPRCCPAA
jgi:hypothetical protein